MCDYYLSEVHFIGESNKKLHIVKHADNLLIGMTKLMFSGEREVILWIGKKRVD